MQKITSYGDGASMSRKFAPDLVTSDAHAAKKMELDHYNKKTTSTGGSGGKDKPPTSKHHAGMKDFEPENPKGNYNGKHRKATDIQGKIWDDKK
jgi:hypothetical protein